MNNSKELTTKINKPSIPDEWDYNNSVKLVKQTIYKWKNLTIQMAQELWIAREKLSMLPTESGKLKGRNKSSNLKTWSDYCEDIGSSRQVINRWLDKWFPQVKTINEKHIIETNKVNYYDNNMLYMSNVHELKETEIDDDVLCIDITHGDKDIRVYKDYYPTVLNVCTFLHKDGKEFSLRDYADVQDFSKNFKFVGSSSEIKRQIGEAVSPKMGEYIINKHIKGNNYIELFAGCGGFSVGAHKLNKKCLWCIDVNKNSGHSFKTNFPKTEVIVNDIKKTDEKEIHNDIGDIDFIIGGPPCQGFSSAGKRVGFKEDERNSLYLDFIRFVNEFKPQQFIMENVKEILNYKDEIKKDFESIGYDVEIELVNGLDIGMKQKRIRVFFIGNKKNV